MALLSLRSWPTLFSVTRAKLTFRDSSFLAGPSAAAGAASAGGASSAMAAMVNMVVVL